METPHEPVLDIPIVTNNIPTIELDWEQYFRTFCEAHGRYPVMYGGMLLFPDGWMYSSTDYEGPEYPPPKDNPTALKALSLHYWQRRYEIVSGQYNELRRIVTGLEQLQLARSSALQQRISYRDDEGKLVNSATPLDMDSLSIRLSWLKDDTTQCINKLKALGISVRERVG